MACLLQFLNSDHARVWNIRSSIEYFRFSLSSLKSKLHWPRIWKEANKSIVLAFHSVHFHEVVISIAVRTSLLFCTFPPFTMAEDRVIWFPTKGDSGVIHALVLNLSVTEILDFRQFYWLSIDLHFHGIRSLTFPSRSKASNIFWAIDRIRIWKHFNVRTWMGK